jgi:hypothetical protein
VKCDLVGGLRSNSLDDARLVEDGLNDEERIENFDVDRSSEDRKCDEIEKCESERVQDDAEEKCAGTAEEIVGGPWDMYCGL